MSSHTNKSITSLSLYIQPRCSLDIRTAVLLASLNLTKMAAAAVFRLEKIGSGGFVGLS